MKIHEPKKIKFDGFEFIVSLENIVLYLYIARRARNGDEEAIDILNTFQVKIIDINGNLYWPVKSG